MTTDTARGEPIIDRQVLEAVADGVRLGKYHLVLGAGASCDCTNSLGRLPIARDLEAILLHECGIDEVDEVVGLQRAYEEACHRRGASAVSELLKTLYSEAIPSALHRRIPLLRWRAIWTFNIDDAVESAYANCEDRMQVAHTVLWKERPRPVDGIGDQVPVVHLHGYVGERSPQDPQLIFSMAEYLEALSSASRNNWHTTFRSSFPSYPSIIVGARLVDEIDFAEIIRQGSISAEYGTPSVIVLPRITAFQRSEFERWNLIPVEATGEEFFRALTQSADQLTEERKGATSLYTSLYTERSILELSSPRVAREYYHASHDFYGGDEPTWEDISLDLDAVPRWVEQLANDVGTPETAGTGQVLYVLCGGAFRGKSTGLLRLAAVLHSQGWEPFYLIGRERLELDEITQYLRDRPRAVLFADPLHFDAHELDGLLRRAAADNRRLIMFGTDRSRHLRRITDAISPRFLVGAVSPVVTFDVTDAFWWQIVRKRRAHARLGRLEGADEPAAKLYFTQHGRDLYSALAELEDAYGFIARGLDAFNSVPEDLRLAFAAIALAASASLSIPATTVAGVSGVGQRRLIKEVTGGTLTEWVALDASGSGVVRLRHPYLGELLLSGQIALPDGVTLLEVAEETCRALARAISPEAIRRGTLEYRLAAELMDERLVKRLADSDDVDAWYATLESEYGWNARFWEQRALAQTRNLDRAFSFAQRAVQERRDGFALNTLGTVLMRRAAAAADRQSFDVAETYWSEAVDALTKAKDHASGLLVAPYSSFFAYTLRLIEAGVPQGMLFGTRVHQAIIDWCSMARHDKVADEPALKSLLTRIPKEWR